MAHGRIYLLQRACCFVAEGLVCVYQNRLSVVAVVVGVEVIKLYQRPLQLSEAQLKFWMEWPVHEPAHDAGTRA